MNWELNGLPLHPLIVHFVVVAFPGAALLLLLSAFWPAARRASVFLAETRGSPRSSQ